MAKFRLVKEVDRVGRMADTLEFTNLALPLDRFAPELLDAARASSRRRRSRSTATNLIVRHCYVERRHDAAQPLPRDGDARAGRATSCASTATRSASWRSRTSSRATCSGATSGSTRHGRVVFYDYDEIEYLTDCVFRTIPPAPNPEAELSGEAWYAVGPLDVFPEEFETFLLGEPSVREAFLRHHADLLAPAFWQECAAAGGRRRDGRLLPVPGGRAVRRAVRR